MEKDAWGKAGRLVLFARVEKMLEKSGFEDVDFATQLLPYGLDFSARGPEGRTVTEFAKHHKASPEMIAFLFEQSP